MGTLEESRIAASACTKCRLAEGRTQVVFGNGAHDADLMFIGEAPGFHEDKQGLPFVGAAGKLLDTLLGDIGLKRGDVYVANILKCRPPGNRDPLPDEIEACTPWLRDQVRMVSPRIVMSLGNFATQFLLGRKVGITRVRGQKLPLGSMTLIPTFHPAAVLRGGPKSVQMQQIQEDFRLVRAELDSLPTDPPPIDPDAEQLGLF